MAKKRKIPKRKCVVTQEKHPKKDLIRVVRTPEGEIEIDEKGKMNGRGAYIQVSEQVAQRAWDKHALDSHLNAKISDDFYEKLLAYAKHKEARRELFNES